MLDWLETHFLPDGLYFIIGEKRMEIDIAGLFAVLIPIAFAWWLNRRSTQSGTYKNLSETITELSQQVKEFRDELDKEIEKRKELESLLAERDSQIAELQKDFDALKKKYERERKEWINRKE